jgi:tetratricopeptide (TPR) repeat protein
MEYRIWNMDSLPAPLEKGGGSPQARQGDHTAPVAELVEARRWLLALLLLLLALPVQAVAPEKLIEQGNQAYEQGDFDRAVSLYDSVRAQGYESAGLAYNLGNAHYRLGQLAPAIVHYERALALDPGHDDAAYNLRLANLRVIDNLVPVPDLFLVEWMRDIVQSRTPGQWAVIALIWLCLALVAGLAFFFVQYPPARRSAFFGALLLLLFSFVTLGVAWQQQQRHQNSRYGIIFPTNVYVKDAPNGQTDLLILHEGVKVRLLDPGPTWTKIKVEDANVGEIVGYVPAKAVEGI